MMTKEYREFFTAAYRYMESIPEYSDTKPFWDAVNCADATSKAYGNHPFMHELLIACAAETARTMESAKAQEGRK